MRRNSIKVWKPKYAKNADKRNHLMSLQSIKDIKMDIILVVESVAISTIGVTIGQ